MLNKQFRVRNKAFLGQKYFWQEKFLRAGDEVVIRLKGVTAETLQMITKKASWNVSWLKSMWKKRTVEMAHYNRPAQEGQMPYQSGHTLLLLPLVTNLPSPALWLLLELFPQCQHRTSFILMGHKKDRKSREKRQKLDYI